VKIPHLCLPKKKKQILPSYKCFKRAGKAQSVQQLVTGWTVRGLNLSGGGGYSAPIQTSPVAHPASCTVSTGSLFWGATARVWQWPPTSIYRQGYRKSRNIPVLSLRAFMAYCRVNFTFTFTNALKVCRDELCTLIQTNYLYGQNKEHK